MVAIVVLIAAGLFMTHRIAAVIPSYDRPSAAIDGSAPVPAPSPGASHSASKPAASTASKP